MNGCNILTSVLLLPPGLQSKLNIFLSPPFFIIIHVIKENVSVFAQSDFQTVAELDSLLCYGF
jgi:hypothetical protein